MKRSGKREEGRGEALPGGRTPASLRIPCAGRPGCVKSKQPVCLATMKSAFTISAACALSVCSTQAADASSYAPAVASLPKCKAANGCLPGVPSDYVLTPAGWFHPSCIVAVHSDEDYDLLSGIITSGGGSTRLAPPCAYLPRDVQGNAFNPAARVHQPPSDSGWLATTWNGSSIGSVTDLQAQWTVPSTPISGNGIVYLFPGLQNTTILQPVLAYNGDDGTGGLAPGWTIQSWDCCDATGNNIMNDSPVGVNQGDRISSELKGTNCNAESGVCSEWAVGVGDEATPQQWVSATIANNAQVFGTGAGQVVGGALEVYAINTCSQLPSSSEISFTVIAQDIDGNDVSPGNMNWASLTGAQTPNCEPTAAETNVGATSTVNIGWSSSAPLPVPAMPRSTTGLIGLLLAGLGISMISSGPGGQRGNRVPGAR